MNIDLRCGNSLEVLKGFADNTFSSVVCDPPYGIQFMSKKWDYDVPTKELWAEVLRVLKPGGILLAFAGTRTQHRMAVNIEDAGFEIRDMIAWVYGSGFPKSMYVSKAIDKVGGVDANAFKQSLRKSVEESGMSRKDIDAKCGFTMRFDTPYEDDKAGWGVSIPSPEKWETIRNVLNIEEDEWGGLIDRVWRGRCGEAVGENRAMSGGNFERSDKGPPVTDTAKYWEGWGTALKPALEPITVARKPLIGTVAANVLEHGTGAINIDGCRVGDFQNTTPSGVDRRNAKLCELGYRPGEYAMGAKTPDSPPGRFPANLIHDGSDEVVSLFPDSLGSGGSVPNVKITGYGDKNVGTGKSEYFGGERTKVDSGSGSAARFFYCAKTSKKDRGEGNNHPTVKPTDLMRYLCRLVTPPGGTVLDPFMGSGSTGKAAVLEGFNFVGIDLDPAYVEIAKARIEAVNK